jgi:hypothetical protein
MMNKKEYLFLIVIPRSSAAVGCAGATFDIKNLEERMAGIDLLRKSKLFDC